MIVEFYVKKFTYIIKLITLNHLINNAPIYNFDTCLIVRA